MTYNRAAIALIIGTLGIFQQLLIFLGATHTHNASADEGDVATDGLGTYCRLTTSNPEFQAIGSWA